MFDVAGTVSFVTGAASGLGKAFAEVMAENGATVVLADMDAGKLEGVAKAMRGKGWTVEKIAGKMKMSKAGIYYLISA